MLSLERKRKKSHQHKLKNKNPLRKRKRASTFSPYSRRDKLQESLIPTLQSNSSQVDCWLVLLQDQANQAELMVTFLRVRNLSSTSRKWKRRRSELLCVLQHTQYS
jgi:hypothetical protein